MMVGQGGVSRHEPDTKKDPRWRGVLSKARIVAATLLWLTPITRTSNRIRLARSIESPTFGLNYGFVMPFVCSFDYFPIPGLAPIHGGSPCCCLIYLLTEVYRFS